MLILEKAVYSVISPESCASIMWRDAGKRAQAAEALRATAPDVYALGCVDDVVPEPPGGAHTAAEKAAELLAGKLGEHLAALQALSTEQLLARRYAKFRDMAPCYVG